MHRPTANRDQAIILMLLDPGLRATELCSLTINDVDLQTGKVSVRHGILHLGRGFAGGEQNRGFLALTYQPGIRNSTQPRQKTASKKPIASASVSNGGKRSSPGKPYCANVQGCYVGYFSMLKWYTFRLTKTTWERYQNL